MRALHDPIDMTPDERLREVAAILAEGILRLRYRETTTVNQPDDAPKTQEKTTRN